MKVNAESVEEYISTLTDDRKVVIQKLRETILKQLPAGFEEAINYGMIGYVVPHSIYPKGYHCNTTLPLPFMAIASQKNFVAFYHMGIYANQDLLQWFITEYNKLDLPKLDMGKSCIRFKKMDKIPYSLLGELVARVTVKDWIDSYEAAFLK